MAGTFGVRENSGRGGKAKLACVEFEYQRIRLVGDAEKSRIEGRLMLRMTLGLADLARPSGIALHDPILL